MKTLIAITVLIALMITSGSIAQSGEQAEPALLAKADNKELSISEIADTHEKIRSSIERESITNSHSDKGYSDSQVPQHSGTSDLKDGSRDISSSIKKELTLEKNLDLEYKSPKVKAEHLPLVMSTKDKKTKGIVFPPFLYLKKQF